MNTENITFQKLPEAVGFLIKEVAQVKEMVAQKEQPIIQSQGDKWFNIDEFSPEDLVKETANAVEKFLK